MKMKVTDYVKVAHTVESLEITSKYVWEALEPNNINNDLESSEGKRQFSHNQKVQTIAKMIQNKDYENLVSMVKVTEHSITDKMSEMYSFSTLCLVNEFCLERMKNKSLVCYYCFAKNIADYRKDLKRSLARNSEVVTNITIPAEYWGSNKSELAKVIKKNNLKVFRFESFGDTMNETQAQNYINICKAFPDVKFTIWSKNPFIWDKAYKTYGKPENMIYIQSSYEVNKPCKILPKFQQFTDYRFTVYSKEYMQNNGIVANCCDGINSRMCKNCMHCYGCATNDFDIVEVLR